MVPTYLFNCPAKIDIQDRVTSISFDRGASSPKEFTFADYSDLTSQTGRYFARKISDPVLLAELAKLNPAVQDPA